MPLIIIKSSVSNLSTEVKELMHEQCQVALSSILQKSRDYVMSILEPELEMSFAGESKAPVAYIEIKNVGILSPEVTSELTGEVSNIIEKNLGVCADRMYIEFQESQRHLWGYDGSTFG